MILAKYLDAEISGLLLQYDAAVTSRRLPPHFTAEKRLGPKFYTGVELSRVNRDNYHFETREAGRAMLADDTGREMREKSAGG